jgi:hypothetical protein
MFYVVLNCSEWRKKKLEKNGKVIDDGSWNEHAIYLTHSKLSFLLRFDDDCKKWTIYFSPLSLFACLACWKINFLKEQKWHQNFSHTHLSYKKCIRPSRKPLTSAFLVFHFVSILQSNLIISGRKSEQKGDLGAIRLLFFLILWGKTLKKYMCRWEGTLRNCVFLILLLRNYCHHFYVHQKPH